MKLAGILMIVAAIPSAAQSSLPFGHQIGSSVANLAESGEDPGAAQARRAQAEVLAGLRIQFADLANGATVPIANRDAAVARLLGQNPCVQFETWAEQQTSDFAESAATGVAAIERTEGKVVFNRFVRDNLRQIYLSYTVTVETLAEEGTYRVSFGAPRESGPAPSPALGRDWKVLTPAKFPAPQIVKAEDSIRLELYSNATQNATRRVVDYVHAGRQDRVVLRKETPRDSYADDAELALTQPRFRMNGVAAAAGTAPETIRGPLVWVYAPGHGRYILSLRPHPEWGFDRAGEVAGNSLTFIAQDGNVVRIDTAERIAAGSGSYTVHMLLDAGWEPADPRDRTRIMIGAALGLIAAGVGP